MKRAILILLPLLLGACEGYTHARLDPVTYPPAHADLSYHRIDIPEGIAVAVRVVAMDGDEAMDDPPDIELRSCDPRLVGVAETEDDGSSGDWHVCDADDEWGCDDGDEETPEEKAPVFVIWGARAGSTCVNVYVDGERERQIVADVRP